MVGSRTAILPTIAGKAWITGIFQHGVDSTNPFARATSCRISGWAEPASGRLPTAAGAAVKLQHRNRRASSVPLSATSAVSTLRCAPR